MWKKSWVKLKTFNSEGYKNKKYVKAILFFFDNHKDCIMILLHDY